MLWDQGLKTRKADFRGLTKTVAVTGARASARFRVILPAGLEAASTPSAPGQGKSATVLVDLLQPGRAVRPAGRRGKAAARFRAAKVWTTHAIFTSTNSRETCSSRAVQRK